MALPVALYIVQTISRYLMIRSIVMEILKIPLAPYVLHECLITSLLISEIKDIPKHFICQENHLKILKQPILFAFSYCICLNYIYTQGK